MSETVCVIIPAYNEEDFIGKCIESLKRAKQDNTIEIIVADNGSKDRTREIAKAAGAKVIIDSSRHVSGLRNLAATQTSADILAFVDSDCIVANDWMEKASYYFNKSDVAAWGSPPTPPSPGTWVQRAWNLIRQKENETQKVAWLESMNLWVRRDLFEKIGGFNESLTTCEDVDFGYRAAIHGQIIADRKIRVTHLGEAATIRHFVRKELWRGQNNWTAISSHGWHLREVKNLLIPINFGLLLPLSIAMQFFFQNTLWLLMPAFLLLFPAMVALNKTRGKRAKLLDYATLLFLLEIYFICRTISTISGVRGRIKQRSSKRQAIQPPPQ